MCSSLQRGASGNSLILLVSDSSLVRLEPSVVPFDTSTQVTVVLSVKYSVTPKDIAHIISLQV